MTQYNFDSLPTVSEFSDYNSKIIYYNLTCSKIAELQKENRDRVKRIFELKKKYFNSFGLTNEAKEIMKKNNIKTYQGVKL